MPALSSIIDKYKNLCRSYRRKMVYCTYCDVRIMFGDWSHHLKTVHSVDTRLTCPCCTGSVSWQRGNATKRLSIARHRVNCLQKMFNEHSKPEDDSDTSLEETAVETEAIPKEIKPVPVQQDQQTPASQSTEASDQDWDPWENTCPPITNDPAEPQVTPPDVETTHGPAKDLPSERLETSRLTSKPLPNQKKRFYDKSSAQIEAVYSSSPSFDGPPCSCIEFFMHGRQPDMKGRTRQPGSFYDPYGDSTLFDVDQGTKHVKFLETSGLGNSIYNVFYYYFTDLYTFFHVMVRFNLWGACKSHSFLPPGQLHVLPYWCLCDGSHTGAEGEQDHRHMIWMMEKQHVSTFQKNWNRLNDPDLTGRNKLHILIKDANHLMNAVYYVSNPKATCDGKGVEKKRAIGSHYWIAREVYPHAKVAMSLLWPDGQIRHVASACQHKSIDSFFDHLQQRPLRVRLKYLNLTVRNCPVPFAKEQAHPTRFSSIYPPKEMSWGFPLNEGPPTIFKYGVPVEMVQVPASQQLTLDESSVTEWLELQKSQYNIFWNCVWEHCYECSLHQKKAVASVRRLKDRWLTQHQRDLARRLREEQRWKKKYKDLSEKMQAMQDIKDIYREREKQFETREKQFENELKALRERVESKYMEEKVELQEVIRTVTAKNNELQAKNNELQNRLDEVQQVRIQQYEERLVDLEKKYEERLADMEKKYEERLADTKRAKETRIVKMSEEMNALKLQVKEAEQARIQQYEEQLADMKKKLETMENTVQSMAQRSVLYIPKYDQG